MPNETPAVAERFGSAVLLWFNFMKGFGEVRFVASGETAMIFARSLPPEMKAGRLLTQEAIDSGALLRARAGVPEAGGSPWPGQLVVTSAKLEGSLH